MDVEKIRWYGHDSFLIEDGKKVIYIDPWKMPSSAPKADYIFVTHDHYDHYSAEDIEKLSGENTIVFCPNDIAERLGERARSLSPEQTMLYDDIKIEAIRAYNIDKSFHPKENDWLGYIITVSDGTRIYHAGDTDFIPEMRDLETDIALLPVSGTYVMTAEAAINAANTFKPKIAIPMHFGDIIGDDNDAVKFGKGFKGKTVVKPVTH